MNPSTRCRSSPTHSPSAGTSSGGGAGGSGGGATNRTSWAKNSSRGWTFGVSSASGGGTSVPHCGQGTAVVSSAPSRIRPWSPQDGHVRTEVMASPGYEEYCGGFVVASD